MHNNQSRTLLSLSIALAFALFVGCAGPSSEKASDKDAQAQGQEEVQEQEESSTNEEQTDNEKVLFRVNAGATEAITIGDGEKWEADKLVWKGDGKWGAEGGKAVNRGGIEIRNTTKDDIYRTERWGMPGYSFKVPNGTYKVRLHFSEAYHAVETVGSRIFSVNVEDKDVLNSFDVFRAAGRSRRTAVIRTVKNIAVDDGELNIHFEFQKLTPLINGIEVIKQP